MHRDVDLLRTLLLRVEESSGRNVFKPSDFVELPERDPGAVSDHFLLLKDAGLIDSFEDLSGYRAPKKYRITSAGYDYLDTIRDPEIWRRTKEVVSDAKGFTLELLGEIAKGFVKTQIKRLTQVEV